MLPRGIMMRGVDFGCGGSVRGSGCAGGWLRSPSVRAGLAQRARIVLLAADGVGTGEIVHRVGVSKPAVIRWKRRYASDGLAGLDDRPKSGRPPMIDPLAIVLATLEPPPERLGVTHGRAGCWPNSWGSATSRSVPRGRSGVCSRGGRRPSSSPPTPSWKPRSVTWWACT